MPEPCEGQVDVGKYGQEHPWRGCTTPLTKAEMSVYSMRLERAPSWSIEFQRESLTHAIADPATGHDQTGLLHARRYG